MDDGATVPLFYEKRVPQVLIQNDTLSEEFYEILEDENLDDAQQAKLENRFAAEGEVVKRDDRFRNMRKALRDYAQGQEGQEQPPVQALRRHPIEEGRMAEVETVLNTHLPESYDRVVFTENATRSST